MSSRPTPQQKAALLQLLRAPRNVMREAAPSKGGLNAIVVKALRAHGWVGLTYMFGPRGGRYSAVKLTTAGLTLAEQLKRK